MRYDLTLIENECAIHQYAAFEMQSDSILTPLVFQLEDPGSDIGVYSLPFKPDWTFEAEYTTWDPGFYCSYNQLTIAGTDQSPTYLTLE